MQRSPRPGWCPAQARSPPDRLHPARSSHESSVRGRGRPAPSRNHARPGGSSGPEVSPPARTEWRRKRRRSVRAPPYRWILMSEPDQSVRVSNAELATVREAMRDLHRLLAVLDQGQLDKIVLTQRNQMRAVLVTLERYRELERNAASA